MPQARGSVAPGTARPVSGDRSNNTSAAAAKPRRAASTGRVAVRTSTSPSAASAGSLAPPSTAPSSARGGSGGGGIRRRTVPPAAPAGAELVPVSVVSAWLEEELETWVRDLDTLVYSLLDDDADAALRYVVERRNAAVKQTSLFERHEGGGGGGRRAAGAGGEADSPLAPLASLEQLAAGKRRRSLEGMQECAERFVAMKRRLRLRDACSGGGGSVAGGVGRGVGTGGVRAAHLNKPRPLQQSLVADSAMLYGRRASSAGASDVHGGYRPGASDASHDGDGSEVTPGVSAAAAAAQQAAATAATAGRPTATASSLHSSYHGSDGLATATSPNCYSVASSAPVGVSDLRGFAPAAEEASVPAAAVATGGGDVGGGGGGVRRAQDYGHHVSYSQVLGSPGAHSAGGGSAGSADTQELFRDSWVLQTLAEGDRGSSAGQ